jgi:ATP-dependent RNA helicase RhlE
LTIETFEAFGFAEPLARALTQCGYATPTPIQKQALAPQLEGRDLLGLAETGSGKTATFVLPVLQKIAADAVEPGPKQVLTLILAPTRELAIQIDQEVASLARNMRIRRTVVLGGVSKGPQINALKRGVHVLVATPGRLLDLVNMRT